MIHRYITLLTIISVLTSAVGAMQNSERCARKDFGFGSFVCVCNSTYCDPLQSLKPLKQGKIVRIVSDKDSKRWEISEENFSESQTQDEDDLMLRIHKDEQFQTILGFGGAFTDASGINIRSLTEEAQSKLLKSYFDSDGLEYNLGRVPIAGTDFSTHPYSYDDLGPGQIDPSLKYFSLAKEDLQYKIPYIHYALNLTANRGFSLKLYGSPWSGPAWMKENHMLNGKGKLLKKFYPAYASYIIKFFDAYKDHGINFYGLTAQNEPTTGLFLNYPFNTMGWLPEEQAEWIGKHLGPRMHQSGYGNVTIFILDDSRILLPSWVVKVMNNKKASKYVGGVAVHWYQDYTSSLSRLDLTHHYFPNLPILYTEACSGWAPWDLLKVIPGSWVRAEDYASDIIQNLLHWVVGWTDWNMALNLEGGPNWVSNFVDSPILINQAYDEFYKQPMYYALAHFSKVLPEGSVRIGSHIEEKENNSIEVVSFKRPDSAFAAILLNKNRESVSIVLVDEGKSYKITLGERSLTSLIWRI